MSHADRSLGSWSFVCHRRLASLTLFQPALPPPPPPLRRFIAPRSRMRFQDPSSRASSHGGPLRPRSTGSAMGEPSVLFLAKLRPASRQWFLAAALLTRIKASKQPCRIATSRKKGKMGRQAGRAWAAGAAAIVGAGARVCL